MNINLKEIKIKGDKKNSEDFSNYLEQIYAERTKSKQNQNIINIHHFVIQTNSKFVVPLICEWLMQSPYEYKYSFTHESFRYHVLRHSDEVPDILIRESLSEKFTVVEHLNFIFPKSKSNPHVRYIG